MTRRSTNPDGSKVERRKAGRYPVAVPIEASWRGPDGTAVKQDALARQANANGCLLQMESYPEIGTRITLTNFLSAEAAEARVLATPNTREGVAEGIIVELVVPNESFWGVSLQVKKTASELQKLEKALQSEGADRRILKEFRDLMNHVRVSAAIVQQLRECQLQGQDDEEVLTALIANRISRATALCQEVIFDLEGGKVSGETEGMTEFQQTLERASDRLKLLMGSRKPVSVHKHEPFIATRK